MIMFSSKKESKKLDKSKITLDWVITRTSKDGKSIRFCIKAKTLEKAESIASRRLLQYELEQAEITHYWMITLSNSKKSVQFYIKAKNLQEAEKNAKEFEWMLDHPKFCTNTKLLLKW